MDKTAKYGILFYKGTSNIGDDIQTYADLRFLPKVDYIIERENMDEFVPDNNEMVNTIFSGWFYHKAENWPPSPFIKPLIISFHLTRNLKIAGWSANVENMFEGFAKGFFEDNAPIGCRDHYTVDHMKDLKIDNYFTGCMTTTIEIDEVKKEEVIYAVDVSKKVIE